MKIVLHKSLRKLLLSLKYWRLNRSLPQFGAARSPVFSVPDMSGSIPDSYTDQIVIFATCDDGYYRKFGRSFIGSIISNGCDCPVHLHLVNPEPGTLDELAIVQQHLPENTLTFTWEKVDLGQLSSEEVLIYYCAIRFWRLSQFMEAAHCKCLCLDIDVLLRMDASPLLNELRSVDIAFYSRFEKFGGNTKLLAGTLFVSNTTAGLSFIGQAGRQIFRYFSACVLLEKFDQQVLYDMYCKVKEQFPNMVFRRLRKPEIDLDFTEQGVIWYPKGSSKRQAIYIAAEQACRRHVDELIAL